MNAKLNLFAVQCAVCTMAMKTVSRSCYSESFSMLEMLVHLIELKFDLLNKKKKIIIASEIVHY